MKFVSSLIGAVALVLTVSLAQAPVAGANPISAPGGGSYLQHSHGGQWKGPAGEAVHGSDFCNYTPRNQHPQHPGNLQRGPLIGANAPSGGIPTNDWWSSLVFRGWVANPGVCDLGSPLYAHPAVYQLHARGMGITYTNTLTGRQGGPGTSTGEGYAYHSPGWGDYGNETHDIIAGSEFYGQTLTVEDWTDWTVETLLKDGGNRSVRSIIGHGLPFSWHQSVGGESQVAARGSVSVWRNSGVQLGLQVNGRNYIAYAPHGSSWTDRGGNRFTAAAGWFSVAVIPDGANREQIADSWQQFAWSPVTGTQVTPVYDQAAGTLRATYGVTVSRKAGSGSTNSTVMALYPHQAKHLTGATPLAQTYTSPRGKMTVLAGASSFTTETPFHGVISEIPAVATAAGASKDRLWNYLEATKDDPLFQKNDETYWAGKALGRAARIVEVADQVGHTQARDKALNAIQGELTDWFTATANKTRKVFNYNAAWGTMIGYPVGEFGSEIEMNDHHFHYGYYIAAAATLARHRPQWANQYGGMVDLLVRDANSHLRNDPMFPYLRSFDIYAGMDWASGHARFAMGNNQESSSEGMNFAGAMIQWAEVRGDQAMRDTGIFMYTTQAEAINKYWFNADNDAFPASQYNRNYAPMVWGDGAQYSLWFGTSDQHEFFYGINTLPLTGSHLYLGYRPDVVSRTLAEFYQRRGGAEPRLWHNILYGYQALHDPSTALAKFTNATDTGSGIGWEEGSSHPHTYNWIRNLVDLGQVDTSVVANYPLATTFTKNSQRSYVVTNSSDETITVTFNAAATGTVLAQVTAGPGKITTRKPDGSTVSFGTAAGGSGIDIPATDPGPGGGDDPGPGGGDDPGPGGGDDPDPGGGDDPGPGGGDNDGTNPDDDGTNPGDGGTSPDPGNTPGGNDGNQAVTPPTTAPAKVRLKLQNVKIIKGKRTKRTIKQRRAARIRVRFKAPKNRTVKTQVRLRVGNRVIGRKRIHQKKPGRYVAVVAVRRAKNAKRGKIKIRVKATKTVQAATYNTKLRVVR